MKNLLLVIFVLTCSLNLMAADKGYLCLAEETDFATVEKLQLPGYVAEIGMIEVLPETCNVPHIEIYSDVCVIKENTIFLGLDLTKSTLKTKDGTVLPLFCERNVDVISVE